MRRSLCSWLTIVVLMTPLPLAAQSTADGLANLVPDLILKGITVPPAGDPGRSHAGHFTLGEPTFNGSQAGSNSDAGAIGAVEAFGDRLKAQFANFPLGSSTGGFTYSFNEQSGIYTRNTQSFGPAFTERAATIGRKKFSLGVNYQHTSFDTFGGLDLQDGSVAFYLPHTDCCNPAFPPPSQLTPGFESDLIDARLTLKATIDTVAMFANYGVTDRFDVGVAIPITHVLLDANVQATILRLSTADSPFVHTFVEGQNVTQTTFAREGTATGIGDVVVRTKYNFLRSPAAGLSLGVDVRLPTGDDADLLGLGTTQGKFMFIASADNDRFSPHMNIGFTVSGKGPVEQVWRSTRSAPAMNSTMPAALRSWLIRSSRSWRILSDVRSWVRARSSLKPGHIRFGREQALSRPCPCKRARPTLPRGSRTNSSYCSPTATSRSCWGRPV